MTRLKSCPLFRNTNYTSTLCQGPLLDPRVVPNEPENEGSLFFFHTHTLPIDCLPSRLAFEMSFVIGVINWLPKLTIKESGVFFSSLIDSYKLFCNPTHTHTQRKLVRERLLPYAYPCLSPYPRMVFLLVFHCPQ